MTYDAFHAPKYVYIIDFGDMIKIGRSYQPEERIKIIERAIGKKAKQHFISRTCFSSAENRLKRELAAYQIRGEFFSYPYKKAVKKAMQIVRLNSYVV